jgi:predicted nuclease of predicted toxin-antitoxin system
MAIGVKVDEDLPQEVDDIFTEYGYDATTVVRQGWQGLGDNDLWIRVQQEKRWLITADKGFADLRFYPPGTHSGVVLFRLEEESRRGYTQLTRRLLQQLDFETIRGAIVIVSHRGIRIRKP